MMFDTLIVNGTSVTVDEQRRVLECGFIGIIGGEIAAVGSMQELPDDVSCGQLIDAAGKALLPGLIDTHGHAGHALTKTVALGTDWTDVVEDVYYACTTPDFWYAEARLAALEKIKFGTTTAVSMIGSVPRIGDLESIDAHFHGVISSGMRSVSGIGSPNPPWPKKSRVWRGGSFTESTINPGDAYDETEVVVRKWHNSNRGKTYAFAMPSRIGISEPNSLELAVEQMKQMRRIAEEYGTRIHAHSYRGDIEFTLKHFPAGLGPDVSLAHCTGITMEEVKILADTGTHVNTGPSTNAHISARCPVVELLDAGANVVICTDGNAPDRTFDLFKDLRICQLLNRNHFNDASLLPAGTVLEMVTIRAAKAIGLDHLVGSLEVGKRADIIFIDVEQAHLAPFFLPVEKLVQAASGQDVTTVIIDGEVVMDQRRLTTMDEKGVLVQAEREMNIALQKSDNPHLLTYRKGLWGGTRYE